MPDNPLKNKYYLMRHGRSMANEEGIIISDPQNGCSAYGLTERGRVQIKESIESSLRNKVLGPGTLIYCSDFLRTMETADLASKILNTTNPVSHTRLRERYFGDYEKSDDSNYKKVWEKDFHDGKNNYMGVESPEEVRARFLNFISEMENQYKGNTILIVSHGDILQIALTWSMAVASKDHRSISHLETGEIRYFNTPDSAG